MLSRAPNRTAQTPQSRRPARRKHSQLVISESYFKKHLKELWAKGNVQLTPIMICLDSLGTSLRWYFYSCSEPANSKRIKIDQEKKQAGNLQLWTIVTTWNYKNRCSDAIPSPSEQTSGSLVLYSQSFAQTRASSISGASELLWSPRILPPP